MNLGFGCKFSTVSSSFLRTRNHAIEPGGEAFCIQRTNTTTVVFYYIDSHFTPQHKAFIRRAVRGYERVGLIFIETSVYSESRIIVQRWRNESRESTVFGVYVDGTKRILIDVDRMGTESQTVAAIMHELGHWIGMNHVCRTPNETVHCSTVGYGNAIMNPNIGESHITNLSPLDLAELNLNGFCVR